MNFRDAEHLSAYLDQQLSAAELTRLEQRLAVEADLRRLLDDLRVARGLLRRVPRRRAPRNFTLNPLSAKVRAPQPRAVPVLRYAGTLAALLFGFTATINALAPVATQSLAAAPAPGYGMGGGAPDTEIAGEALPLEASGTPAAEAPAAPDELAVPTADAFAKTGPAESGPAPEALRGAPPPISPSWVLVLAVLGILLIGLSWYVDRRTRRDFRSQLLEK